MSSFGRLHVGFAFALLAAAPIAHAQRMYKCADGAGGTTFQQAPCPETAKEAEVRQKEKERIEAEAQRKKEEEARKKEEAAAKAKERDVAYQKQMEERAAELKRAQDAEKKLTQGTTRDADIADDGTLPPGVAALYPGAWREDLKPEIAAAFAKNQTKGCDKFRYRQRAGGRLQEYLVHCTTNGVAWHPYFVWTETGNVRSGK